MKHTNKKGFTIVELVIVIAVIAILAAVLIPNLSRLVTKANDSAALQQAEAELKQDLIEANGDYTKIVAPTETGATNPFKGSYASGVYTASNGYTYSTATGKWTAPSSSSGN